MDEVTEWFPADVKPAYVGVYQQMCGYGKTLGYQYWDGEHWYPWHRNADDAFARYKCSDIENLIRDSVTADPWRGLKEKP